MFIHPVALFVAIPIVLLTLSFVYFLRASSVTREQRKIVAGVERGAVAKARYIGYWTTSIVLAIVFIIAGLPKVVDMSELFHRFSDWGYSEEFLTFIGGTELIAGILLLVPKTSLYAASYLSIIMAGAIYTHLAFDPLPWVFLPAVVLAFLSFIIYEDLHKKDRPTFSEVFNSRK